MRFLVYNIAYGTGAPGGMGKNILTAHRYLRTPEKPLDDIIRFISAAKADIVGLVGVDTGSFRTDYVNQADRVAMALNQYYHCGVKYGLDSLSRRIPILRRQANALLTKQRLTPYAFHYFPIGFKRLIIEVDLNGIHIFLVHLALVKRSRKIQLKHLSRLIPRGKPVIIGGDFNTLDGDDELAAFMEKLSLRNANLYNTPTFPSWNAEKQLDFILYSPEIRPLDFRVADVRFSDHLPVVFDFELK